MRVFRKRWSRKRLAGALCAGMLLGASGYYYARITSYPVPPIDRRVVFVGTNLTYTYCYDAQSKPIYRNDNPLEMTKVSRDGVRYAQPVTHCNLTLRQFHRFLETGDEGARTRFVQMAQTLRDAGVEVTLDGEAALVWPYAFEMKPYAPHPVPWISCLAQGLSISVLCRAYVLTGDPTFLSSAQRAVRPFEVPVAKGGLAAADAEGNLYYEEYPFPDKSFHVLNGFITSLFGLHELDRVTGDQRVGALFDRGVRTLQVPGVLERYDLGFWTTYDQSPGRKMSFKYNALHARQLWALAAITGDRRFRDVGDRWARYNREHRYRVRFFAHAVWHYAKNARDIPVRSLIP